MVYFISGLGADERVFQFLKLPGVEKRFIKWVNPFQRESLSSYCKKLIPQIDTQKEIILIGISFGGIIAQELAKLIPCKKIIIISSVKSRAEFNWQLKLVSNLQLHRIVPLWFLQMSNKLTANYYFDVKDKAEAKLLQQIIKDTDPTFLIWAIDRIMNWHEYNHHQSIIHIHGSIDKIFPIKNIQNFIEIPNGGHFMIVNKVDQLEPLIFDQLKKIKMDSANTDILHIDDVKLLVDDFYDKVRNSVLLSPIFNDVIGNRWILHLEKMYGFWQTLLLETPAYSGSPFLKHANLPIEKEHFDTWISLFNETVDSHFTGVKADEAKWRAARMSEMFQYKLEYYRNNPAKPLI